MNFQRFTPLADSRIEPLTCFSLLLATLLISCSLNTSKHFTANEQLERLKEIQSRHEEDVLALPGILGIGIGRSDTLLVFSVLVDRSKALPNLPPQIEGIPVLVELRNPLKLLNGFPACGTNNNCHTDQLQLPVEMGNSGSWNFPNANSCSLGFKACDLETRKVVFVTASHCNQNNFSCNLASTSSSSLWQHPGLQDIPPISTCFSSGTCSNIGTITGHAAPSCSSKLNLVDATKVESSSVQTSNAFRDIGFAEAGRGKPMIGDLVRKSGRTTGDTLGMITNINVTYNVPPPPKGFCCGPLTMKDQIEWRSNIDGHQDSTLLKGGDSGSALLSHNPGSEFQVVGLNWGVGENYNYANHIDNVLSALNLSLNFVSCFEDCVFGAMASRLSDPKAAVSLGHSFRELVLEKSPRGRRYASIYYQITDEAVRIVAANPGLLAQTVKIFRRESPVIKALVMDGEVDISRTDLVAIDGLLREYQNHGSSTMRTALDIIRRDLYDHKVLAEFNVTVR